MSRRYIIAGGGTGGHIFPALAIAQAIGRTEPQAEILFVGAKGKMEMEKVPEAGYRIEGLDIAGFNRSSLIKNVGLPLKLVKSVWQVRQILQRFRPHAVLGVGGYSTFPVLLVAQWKGIPTFIHEANSYAGKANRLLGKKATKVFTATDGMEAFFPPGRICITGNPVREAITGTPLPQEAARSFFGLQPHRSTLLVVGGSLGARSINAAVDAGLDRLLESGLQVIWQTGKLYAGQARQRCAGKSGVWVSDFIGQMDQAYAAADIIVSRAGAMSIAEICVVAKPAVLVPFPFAAEDHQTVNARHLVHKGAALLVRDADAATQLVPTVVALSKDAEAQEKMREQLRPLGIRNAAETVVTEMQASLQQINKTEQ